MMNESVARELNFGDISSGVEFKEIHVSHCAHSINSKSTFKPCNKNLGKDMYECTSCGKVIDLSEIISKDTIKISCEIVSSVLDLVKILKIDYKLFLRFCNLPDISKDVSELNSIAMIQHSVRNNVIPLYYYIHRNIPMIRFNFTKEELLKACEIVDNVFDIVKYSIYNMLDNETQNEIEGNIISLDNTYSSVEFDLLKSNKSLNEYVMTMFNKILV